MKERIQQLIAREGLTAAQFADKVGLQRSTLSHILSGRNNPSIDVVTRIHATYPNIPVNWLMFGEGEPDAIQNPEKPYGMSLENERNMATEPAKPQYGKEFDSNGRERTPYVIDFENDRRRQEIVIKEVIKVKAISKIMIFYADNTFETFSSDTLKEKP